VSLEVAARAILDNVEKLRRGPGPARLTFVSLNNLRKLKQSIDIIKILQQAIDSIAQAEVSK